jgi:hypothetical protein
MIRGAVLAFLALAAGAALVAQAQKTDPARVEVMHERFDLVLSIQAEIVRGDLPAARQTARALTEKPLQADAPDVFTRHAKSIADDAREASTAPDVLTAAVATARMLSTCGMCHRASGVMPAPTSRQWPSVGGTVGHMLDHQRAMDQLLRGMTVPSQSEWLAGARGLRASPLHARDLPRDPKLTPELLRVEETVHRLAEEAIAAETPNGRVRVYSTLLAGCADCHSLHRRIWGPGPSR